MTITSERIHLRRKQLKMSQETLAFRMGTNQTQISRYERGENSPTADVLSRFADALDTTTDYLLGRTNIVGRPLRGEGDLEDSESALILLLRRQDPETRQRILNAIKALVPEGV